MPPIVDIGLPARSGLEIIRRWRTENRSFPVVVFTARCGWRNRVDGIQAGADDYIEKPFRFEELLARIQCIVRRVHGWSSPQVICGPYALDTDSLTASVEGEPLDLTSYEFRLLEILMLNAGKVLSATALAEHIYNESADHESNVVQYFISRLRSKLDPTNRIKPIETVYGGGYRFAVPRGQSESVIVKLFKRGQCQFRRGRSISAASCSWREETTAMINANVQILSPVS